MILESKEEAIASKMKTLSPASVSLSRITCWASTTSNHRRGKVSPKDFFVRGLTFMTIALGLDNVN